MKKLFFSLLFFLSSLSLTRCHCIISFNRYATVKVKNPWYRLWSFSYLPRVVRPWTRPSGVYANATLTSLPLSHRCSRPRVRLEGSLRCVFSPSCFVHVYSNRKLFSNESKKLWAVRCILFILAVWCTCRLRVQLLSLWTTSVKRLGYQLIAFMLLVFRDWNDEEVSGL